MEPKQAWGAFSFIIMLADAVSASVLVEMGYEVLPVIGVAGIAALIYFYILYKRYHVEVVPESDVMLFDDTDDLRILCRIYGLDHDGGEAALRKRLIVFSKAHTQDAFTWVAPRSVISVGSSLSLEGAEGTGGEARTESASQLAQAMIESQLPKSAATGILPKGAPRTGSRRSRIKVCPICGVRTPISGSVCNECGADLEFYAVMSESRVGKRMISTKATATRRKLRYPLPPSGEGT